MATGLSGLAELAELHREELLDEIEERLAAGGPLDDGVPWLVRPARVGWKGPGGVIWKGSLEMGSNIRCAGSAAEVVKRRKRK